MLSRSKPQRHEKRREAMPGTTYTLESRIGTRTFADRPVHANREGDAQRLNEDGGDAYSNNW